jgi:hypothetical protein
LTLGYDITKECGENLPIINKTKHLTTKRNKMEGPKSWQTKETSKAGKSQGNGNKSSTQTPTPPHPPTPSCEKHIARILVKIFGLCVLACDGRTGQAGEELWELDIRYLVQF